MTCCVDLAGLLGLSFVWSRLRGAREQRRRERLAQLKQLAQRFLGRDLSTVATSGISRLPAGADNSAASALAAVNRYEEHFRVQRAADGCMTGLSGEGCFTSPLARVPTSVLSIAGLSKSQDEDLEAESLTCAEMKPWLLSAAACAVPADEVYARLEFYRQLLMRPEVFGEDPAFFLLLASVCQHLEELLGRLAGASRSCALLLGKVLSTGQELLDTLLPVLLLAICDAVEPSALPHISMESLLASAGGAEANSSSAFAGLWKKDNGRILRELIMSKHFGEFWGRPAADKVVASSMLDMWLELRHAWADALDSDFEARLRQESGVHELFRSRSCREVQQCFLDLHKHLDNVVKFFSLAGHYRRLANIAGDAAMYHLRTSLHHLLQEIELAVVQVAAAVSRIMQEVRRTVMNITQGDTKTGSRQLLWLERLRLIDEHALGRCQKALLETFQELRYLSSETRLPKLQASCRKSLEQITDITASSEFRSRCAEAPPKALMPSEPLESVPAESQVQNTLTAWSVERQFSLQQSEVVALRRHGKESLLDRHPVFSTPGAAVEALNEGVLKELGEFCLIRCGQQTSAENSADSGYVCLVREGCRQAAQEALGLDSLESTTSAASRSSIAAAVAEAQLSLMHEAPETPEASDAAQARDAPEVRAIGKLCEEEEQNRFYGLLMGAVLPLLGDGTSLSGDQTVKLLQRAGLSEMELQDVLTAEGVNLDEPVEAEGLCRLLKLVACVQSGCSDVSAAQRQIPDRVPAIRGLNWDGKKLRITEAMS
eukprot:TRINITY_DN92636_c0_g1_i1.p1 TRINITY_DN92636_c0_g1~~TRINITY_DN92636_c0_g1_i1.p1  ORF type:complete len:775 (-),score=176.00 TRINITY_DN92636_c0_g1_i1:40-2364(-)